MRKNSSSWRGPDLRLRFEFEERTLFEGSVAELTFPLVIGREAICAWRAPEEASSLSHLHAELTIRHRSQLWFRDLGSKNGTFLRGKKVSELRLKAGMQLSLGRCTLYVENSRRKTGESIRPYHRLVQLTGPEAPRTIDLVKTVTIIGFDVGPQDIKCDDVNISRKHAQIEHRRDDTCWLRDLNSTNGTSINQLHLKPDQTEGRMLRDGDIISIATYLKFKFEDRNGVPPPPILRYSLIAVTTMCVCGMAYLGYQWISPSAKSLLRDAQNYERSGRFALARTSLNKALTARGSGEYRDEVNRKLSDVARWINTKSVWDDLGSKLKKRQWNDTSRDLGYLLDPGVDRWGWNTDDALKRKKQAQVIYASLQVFLDACKVMGGDFPRAARGKEEDYLEGRLQTMKEHLDYPGWGELPETEALQEDMKELSETLSAILKDLKEVDDWLAKIRPVPSESPSLQEVVALAESFDSIAEALERLCERAETRERQREEAAKKTSRRYVPSYIVRQRCQNFIPTLRKFSESRQMLRVNIDHLVAFERAKLKKDIAYPSDQQSKIHPALGGIRGALEKANAAVCGVLAETVGDQLGRMYRWGLEKAEKPACVLCLQDAAVLDCVLRCDSIDGPYCQANRTRRMGKYDEIVGVEEFANFLRSVAEERAYPESPAELPVPQLAAAIQFFRQNQAFCKWLDQPDILYLLSIGGSQGNRLKEMADKSAKLERQKSVLVDQWFNYDAPTRRARLIGKGMALALDAGRQLGEEEIASVKKDMADYREEVSKLKMKLDDHPEEVQQIRSAILAVGLPRLEGVVSREWAERSAGGRK